MRSLLRYKYVGHNMLNMTLGQTYDARLGEDRMYRFIDDAGYMRTLNSNDMGRSFSYVATIAEADADAFSATLPIDADTMPEPDETSASFTVPDGYMDLALTLIDAFNQAARGKGNERHAKDRRFDDQPIRNIPRVQGNISGLVYQMMKKANEADMMHERGEHDPAIREFYGVINYAAAAILHIKERKGKDDGN